MHSFQQTITHSINPSRKVISSSNPEDDCYLYKLADFRKSGQLVDKFLNEGSKGLDDFIQKLGPFMYWSGKGELITR